MHLFSTVLLSAFFSINVLHASIESTLIDYGIASNTIDWVHEKIDLTQPEHTQLITGSEIEYQELIQLLVRNKTLIPLNQDLNPGSYLARSNPNDVARVEEKTFICSNDYQDAGATNNWKHPNEMRTSLTKDFSGSMKGRTLYIVPFCMGPIGSPYSRFGIQLTDSPYVVASMYAMTRMGTQALMQMKDKEIVHCLHSMGVPLEKEQIDSSWPCNPDKLTIAHFPESSEVWSFGSNYGGNALLNKKCFALRIASVLGREQGWLAEHMLICSITNPKGEKRYITAAFPSACGKTNLAMLESQIPGWKVEVVGDDIAWLNWAQDGTLRAINPEAGFFGVAPGTSEKTNAVALRTIRSNTIFTNVALLPNGDVWWEGKTETPPESAIDWQGNNWNPSLNTKAAHPNSRFCVSINNCPTKDSAWEDPEGVPISAIIFGGRRATTIPLVRESFNWDHGVFLGASISSETTAAAAGNIGKLRHDPFAMLPFCGYNILNYFQHWRNFGKNRSNLPKIFAVNWFRKGADGSYLWPGYQHNMHILQWIYNRCEGNCEVIATPIGLIPRKEEFTDLPYASASYESLFEINPKEWKEESNEFSKYFSSLNQ